MKKTFWGILIAICCLSFFAVASASNGTINAKLTYSDIKLYVDGRAVTLQNANGKSVEPFTIDGTTYLPMRAVAELLGMNVNWDSKTNSINLSSHGNQPAPGTFNAATVESQLLVNQYHYASSWFNYAFLEITNNSNYDLNISVSATFYDESGNLVGAKSDSLRAFEQGTSALFYFLPDEKYATMEYDLKVEQETRYYSVVSDLSYTESRTQDKVILSVTNNGKEAADFVRGHILFFKNGKVVGHDWNYITDNDSELKAGATIHKEFNCYNDFDSFKVYFSGRR